MIKSRLSLFWFAIAFSLLASCVPAQISPTPSSEEVLQNLNVNSQSDLEALSPCEQVKIYTVIASQNLDIEHGVGIVPQWIDEVISKQPKDDVALCIAKQGELLVNQWEDVYDTTNLNLSHQVLALVYKAGDLDIIDNTSVLRFVSNAVCNKKIYYRENIALIYYVETQSDMQNIPDPNGLIDLLCS